MYFVIVHWEDETTCGVVAEEFLEVNTLGFFLQGAVAVESYVL